MQRHVLVYVAAVVATACGERSESSEGIVPAAAFERPDQDEAAKKIDAMRRKADERAEAEAKKAEAELAALTDAVTILPPKLPRSLEVACDDVAESLDSI